MASKMWFPQSFSKKTPVFMSASHRGDMYHVRAMISQEPRPVYLYDYNDATKKAAQDLVDYLGHVASLTNQDFFVVPWDRDTCMNTDKVPEEAGSLNGKTLAVGDLQSRRAGFISEGSATSRLVNSIALNGVALEAISNSMAIIPDSLKGGLDESFDKILHALFGREPSNKFFTVLVLHRDSGQLGGAYPELDSGEALGDILDIIKAIPAMKDGRPLKAVLCGDVKAMGDVPSIGPYWKELASLDSPKELKRDIEAYFLKRAFVQGFFQMAVGFRSGGLDLFTFMGIPTVSIGLRNLVGEDRHGLLARREFKRVNVQYEQPRHTTTAWIEGRPERGIVVNLLASPYWLGTAPPEITIARDLILTSEERAAMQAKAPGPFAPFDKFIFHMGMSVACENYLKWDQMVKRLENVGDCIITSSVGRYCYPFGMTIDKLRAYFEELKALEDKDLADREDRRGVLQETDSDWNVNLVWFKRDWFDVFSLLDEIDIV